MQESILLSLVRTILILRGADLQVRMTLGTREGSSLGSEENFLPRLRKAAKSFRSPLLFLTFIWIRSETLGCMLPRQSKED